MTAQKRLAFLEQRHEAWRYYHPAKKHNSSLLLLAAFGLALGYWIWRR